MGTSNDLLFRGMEIKEQYEKRRKAKEAKIHLEAMVLRTKPEANKWLHLTPRITALDMDAFERGPSMIYLVKKLNLADNAEEKSAELIDGMCKITLEAFWTQNVRREEGFERTDSILEGLGTGWTASFLSKVYPALSRYLMKEFLNTITKLSIYVILRLFVTFGPENIVNGPAVLLTEWDTQSPNGCTSDINCDHAWKIRKIDKFIPLPRADERECEKVRHETVYGLLY